MKTTYMTYLKMVEVTCFHFIGNPMLIIEFEYERLKEYEKDEVQLLEKMHIIIVMDLVEVEGDNVDLDASYVSIIYDFILAFFLLSCRTNYLVSLIQI